MLFLIKAVKKTSGKSVFWHVTITEGGVNLSFGTFSDAQWDAFQSLLMPCVRADFRIEESNG